MAIATTVRATPAIVLNMNFIPASRLIELFDTILAARSAAIWRTNIGMRGNTVQGRIRPSRETVHCPKGQSAERRQSDTLCPPVFTLPTTRLARPLARMKPLLLVIDDHPLYRVGVIRMLSDAFSVIEAESITSAVSLLQQHPHTALVLLDLRLPDTRGLSGLEILASRFREIPRVVISGDDDPALPARVRAAGASGFVHKNADIQSLSEALKRVLDGHLVFDKPAGMFTPGARAHEAGLSLREIEVLTLASRGLSNKEIAARLDISERTVKAHLNAAFVALGAKSRTEAAYIASRKGLIEPA